MDDRERFEAWLDTWQLFPDRSDKLVAVTVERMFDGWKAGVAFERMKKNALERELLGQLKNCVNHLELAKRSSYKAEDRISPCIESANAAITKIEQELSK